MITLYAVADRRTLLAEYVPGTREANYADARPRIYDLPTVPYADVIAASKRGETTPGYEVSVERLGEGTTVTTAWEWMSRGWDDGDSVRFAAYRDDAGAWKKTLVSYDRGDAGNTAEVDASPEVLAAYAEHLRAEAAAEDARRAEMRREKAEDDARRERSSVEREKFVIVARGRKVPVGTVGRCFYLAPSEWGTRAGVATTTRTTPTVRDGRTYQNAADVAWSAASNLDVLLQEMPRTARETDALHRFAAAVAAHCDRGESGDDIAEHFPGLWAWAYDRPERLAVMACYAPGELPRIDADTPRTLADVCEAVETMPEVASFLAGVAMEFNADTRDAARAAIVGTLGEVYVAPVKAKRARKAREAVPA